MSKRCSASQEPAIQPAPASPVLIGIDVGKDQLVIAQHEVSGVHNIANTQAGIKAWLKTVPKTACIALESTGRYSRLISQLAHEAGLTVYLLNALDVHHYGKALGQRGKTDRLDAQLIALYLVHQKSQLRPWQPPPVALEQLRSLMRCRAQVVKASVKLRMTLQDTPILRKQAQAIAKQFEQTIKSIDQKMKDLVKEDAALLQGAERLRSIQGVGPLGATLLATLLARVPFVNADALVAYTGLDPRPTDSGKKQGVRRLSKRGDPQLRQQMWLCAMSASRCSGFKARYEALKLKGLPTTAAYVVIARKLLRIAFAIWHSDQLFDPAKLAKPPKIA
jgi:transposase